MAAALIRTVDLPPGKVRPTLQALKTGPRDTSSLFGTDGWWHCRRTPDGPASLQLEIGDAGAEWARVSLWGPGAERLAEQIPRLVGSEDDPSGFDSSAHPTVQELARRHGITRHGRTDAVFAAAVPVIIGQKVTVAGANRSYARLLRRFSEPAPGPAPLMLPPEADRLAAEPYTTFHELGIERKRAETIRRVAAAAPMLERLGEAPSDGRVTRLQSIRGVGAWTTAGIAGVAWGDPDAVPVGDYKLPHHVAWVLAGEARADDARMLDLLEPFAGHRARVLRLIGHAGTRPPRYGPRLAVRDIRHH